MKKQTIAMAAMAAFMMAADAARVDVYPQSFRSSWT